MNLDYSYTGDRAEDYADGAIILPSYGLANFRTGIDFDNTSIELYVNNIFDKDGFLSIYDDFAELAPPERTSGYPGFGYRRTGSKPRVIGIRFRYRY